MSTLVDEIWNTPVEQRAPSVDRDSDVESSAPRPSRLRRSAVDLPGSDEDMPEVDPELEQTLKRVFEDDGDFDLPSLSTSIDQEALRREAEAKYRNMPPLTPHEILPSSSPPRDTGEERKRKEGPVAKGKDSQKERRKIMRLDEGRLLGPTGFPQLITDTKHFRIKGKGHEVSDLLSSNRITVNGRTYRRPT